MSHYIATEIADNDQGHHFEAPSLRDARAICKRNGWRLDGTLIATIPAEETSVQQMDELIARRNAGVRNDA